MALTKNQHNYLVNMVDLPHMVYVIYLVDMVAIQPLKPDKVMKWINLFLELDKYSIKKVKKLDKS